MLRSLPLLDWPSWRCVPLSRPMPCLLVSLSLFWPLTFCGLRSFGLLAIVHLLRWLPISGAVASPVRTVCGSRRWHHVIRARIHCDAFRVPCIAHEHAAACTNAYGRCGELLS